MDDNLKKSLQELERQLKTLKRFAEFSNRDRFLKKGAIDRNQRGEIDDNISDIFDDLYDNKWDVYINKTDYTINIDIRKALKISDAEHEFNNLLDRMYEVSGRLKDIGYNPHFLIHLNGRSQQDLNPNTHRNDLYSFKGVGDNTNILRYYKNGKYSPDEYFLAKVNLVFI